MLEDTSSIAHRQGRCSGRTGRHCGILLLTMIGLSIWYLTRREPLVVQGEVQSRTFDMAARVDGRVGKDRRRPLAGREAGRDR